MKLGRTSISTVEANELCEDGPELAQSGRQESASGPVGEFHGPVAWGQDLQSRGGSAQAQRPECVCRSPSMLNGCRTKPLGHQWLQQLQNVARVAPGDVLSCSTTSRSTAKVEAADALPSELRGCSMNISPNTLSAAPAEFSLPELTGRRLSTHWKKTKIAPADSSPSELDGKGSNGTLRIAKVKDMNTSSAKPTERELYKCLEAEQVLEEIAVDKESAELELKKRKDAEHAIAEALTKVGSEVLDKRRGAEEKLTKALASATLGSNILQAALDDTQGCAVNKNAAQVELVKCQNAEKVIGEALGSKDVGSAVLEEALATVSDAQVDKSKFKEELETRKDAEATLEKAHRSLNCGEAASLSFASTQVGNCHEQSCGSSPSAMGSSFSAANSGCSLSSPLRRTASLSESSPQEAEQCRWNEFPEGAPVQQICVEQKLRRLGRLADCFFKITGTSAGEATPCPTPDHRGVCSTYRSSHCGDPDPADTLRPQHEDHHCACAEELDPGPDDLMCLLSDSACSLLDVDQELKELQEEIATNKLMLHELKSTCNVVQCDFEETQKHSDQTLQTEEPSQETLECKGYNNGFRNDSRPTSWRSGGRGMNVGKCLDAVADASPLARYEAVSEEAHACVPKSAKVDQEARASLPKSAKVETADAAAGLPPALDSQASAANGTQEVTKRSEARRVLLVRPVKAPVPEHAAPMVNSEPSQPDPDMAQAHWTDSMMQEEDDPLNRLARMPKGGATSSAGSRRPGKDSQGASHGMSSVPENNDHVAQEVRKAQGCIDSLFRVAEPEGTSGMNGTASGETAAPPECCNGADPCQDSQSHSGSMRKCWCSALMSRWRTP